MIFSGFVFDLKLHYIDCIDGLSCQVPETASEAQLKSAYKKGALKYHPGM